MSKYCVSCGTELKDDDLFCSKCGKGCFSNGEVSHTTKFKKAKFFIPIICVIIVILIATIIALMTTGNKPDTKDIETNEVVVEEKIDIISKLKSNVGVYETTSAEIALVLFDVSANGEVYFEVGLKEDWVISGVAKLNENCANFSVTDDMAGENKLSITFNDDNTITLNIQKAQKNFEENIGTYTLYRDREVNNVNTYCDNNSSNSNHTIFSNFLKKSANSGADWKYLGHTLGDFGVLSYENSGLNTDIYKIMGENEREHYYIVFLSNEMTGTEYGVKEIVSGKESDFLFTMETDTNYYEEPIYDDASSGNTYEPVQQPESKKAIYTYTHAALEGAVIISSDTSTGAVKYKDKCEKCGNVSSSTHNTYIKGTTLNSSFYCSKCKSSQKVRIQSTMDVDWE